LFDVIFPASPQRLLAGIVSRTSAKARFDLVNLVSTDSDLSRAEWHAGLGTSAVLAHFVPQQQEKEPPMRLVLLIILILLLVGALPLWPYSTGWGYYPGSGLGLVLVIVLVLILMGRI
jgi:peptidoglycan/LPS O-acetylase OafA/YrhL